MYIRSLIINIFAAAVQL